MTKTRSIRPIDRPLAADDLLCTRREAQAFALHYAKLVREQTLADLDAKIGAMFAGDALDTLKVVQ